MLPLQAEVSVRMEWMAPERPSQMEMPVRLSWAMYILLELYEADLQRRQSGQHSMTGSSGLWERQFYSQYEGGFRGMRSLHTLKHGKAHSDVRPLPEDPDDGVGVLLIADRVQAEERIRVPTDEVKYGCSVLEGV